MSARLLQLTVAWLMAAVCASPARAHLLPTQHGTINLLDSAAFVALSVPVSALRGWDTNGDGQMSADELMRHRAALLAQLDAGIVIRSGADRGRRDLLQPSIEFPDGAHPTFATGTHLLVLIRQSFRAVPTRIALRLTLRGAAESEREFIVSATDHGAREVAVLSPSHPEHTFFSPVTATVLRWMRARLPAGNRVTVGLCLTLMTVIGVVIRSRRRRMVHRTVISASVPRSV